MRKTCKKRVLLIEDDEQQAEALSEALQLTGCSIEVAMTGNDGVEKARKIRPDVILCDIRLPDIDGYEVARRIRADSSLQSSRLVALSAYAVMPKDSGQPERAGFEAYLMKPPPFEDLERWIVEGTRDDKAPGQDRVR